MASLDDLLRQLGIGGVARNRAGQIVTNTSDIVPVATAGLADTLYGAGRGTLAGTAAIGGIPGDINQMYVNKFGALFPNQPAPPTSEQISTAVKRAVPPLNLSRDNTGSVATSLGENVASPLVAPEGLLKTGTKTAKYAAPVVGSAAENYAARTGLLQPIVPYEVAKNINMETKLPSSAEFASAVENTPGARITEDGLAIRLQRNQVPEQSGMESVRTGVFYLPEGSTNSRYYKNATAGYGGKEEITGETLLKNPLFVKGATGGKAPEMAFDAIKGKGAMKELDADVNRIVMGSSFIKQKDPALYQEMVSEFLQKYGSNPDTASYIIDNSKKGNQLKYALRENAIANAVRNAGHDAVLGYSKGKKGNFFSEVFDVRELDYPTVEGDFRLNPIFTGSIKPTGKFINEAHQTASINAEKMLGLPPGNTAMDRAKALGYDTPAYRGVREEVNKLNPITYSTNLPEGAAMYAGSETGANVMPLLIRSKNPYIAKDYGDIGLFSERKANELKKLGFDSAMYSQSQKNSAPYVEYVSIDPSNVRSRFAAFDPARANEADLLAGVVPLGLIAGKDQLELKKEKKPKK